MILQELVNKGVKYERQIGMGIEKDLKKVERSSTPYKNIALRERFEMPVDLEAYEIK